MKLHSLQHVYDLPWHLVTAGHWQKYPNSHTQHVLSVDTIDQHVSPEGILVTRRLLTVRQSAPRLFARLFGSSEPVSHVLEVSHVDPTRQTFSAISTNLTFRNLVVIDEQLKFSPVTGSDRTNFEQTVAISTGLPSRVADYIESALISRFESNAVLGRLALASVVEHLLARSVTGDTTTAAAVAAGSPIV